MTGLGPLDLLEPWQRSFIEHYFAPRPRALSNHAIARYRRRVRQFATVDDIQAALEAAEIRAQPPGWVHRDHEGRTRLWAVAGTVVFPLAESGSTLLAVTCIRKRRIPKADRRAYREQRRDIESR